MGYCLRGLEEKASPPAHAHLTPGWKSKKTPKGQKKISKQLQKEKRREKQDEVGREESEAATEEATISWGNIVFLMELLGFPKGQLKSPRGKSLDFLRTSLEFRKEL